MADPQALHEFSKWVAGCSGNEKQEARTFIEKLIRAWGWNDSVEADVKFEQPISRAGLGGGIGYADALIPGKVLIEMKSRGNHLGDHAAQLQRYWCNLTPKPKYAVLCNFDEFWIYDYNLQWHEPVDALKTDNIASRYTSLLFFSKKPETPLFNNNQVEITEKQAHSMGELFYELKEQARKSDAFTELQAQRFVLQCVLCMFAEDRAMLPDRQFSLALEACKERRESTYDVLSGLFTEMNTPGITPGGRFKGTPYFNGGLFTEISRIELSDNQLKRLVESAREDWKSVRPSIFGNIFEASSDPEKRHRLGQHFTSEADIMKVVLPTIVEPWEEKINQASSIGELDNLLLLLQQYRVLDPACGSGNFLYMGYNSLKEIEALILKKIQERRKSETLKGQGAFGFVTTNQFYGMDTDPFAVELARVTLMIARKVAHDRLGLTEQELPLDNLDRNIVQADALFEEWQEADAIIGNPPFLGTHFMRKELGDAYVDRVYATYPEMKDVDFCTHWFRKAHNAINENGRVGLVGTNSVREGKSRKASLDYVITNGGYFNNAISTQKWSGDAKVFVSIVNWSKKNNRLCFLDERQVSSINSSLRPGTDVSKAAKLLTNKYYSFVGVQPNGKGFVIDKVTAIEWIEDDCKNSKVLKPFSMGGNLTDNPIGVPERWIIDFADKTLEEVECFRKPYDHVKNTVRNERLETEEILTLGGTLEVRFKQREEILREKWWRFKRTNERLREKILSNKKYFGVPRLSKWSIFISCEPNWLPGDLVVVVASDDLFIQGILSSEIHRQWVECQKSTLKGDIRYTHTTCFETFPFPQSINLELVNAIRLAMDELNNYRDAWMIEKRKGITEIYNRYYDEPASKLAKLHRSLDALVLKAYGWSAKDDILTNLLDLNQELAEREAQGEKVVGPWDPNRSSLE
jgi:SAM-dependent methyltransferase